MTEEDEEDRIVNPYDTNPFEESDSRYDSWALRNLPFRETVLDISKRRNFKYDTVTSFEIFVNDVLSSNLLLSNQTPPKKGMRGFLDGEGSFNQYEYSLISFDECKERCLASIDPLDRNKNSVYQIVNEIDNHTKNYSFTRTVGKDREGIINRIEHTKQTQEIRSTETAEQESAKIKKDGIF